MTPADLDKLRAGLWARLLRFVRGGDERCEHGYWKSGLSYKGSGRISVCVACLVRSPKVQADVAAIKAWRSNG